MKYENMIIQTERLVLKVLDESFAHIVLDYHIRNKEFLNKWEPVKEEDFYTLGYQRKLLKRDIDEIKAERMFRVWIFKKGDNTFEKTIGCVSLNNIVRGCFQSCFLGYRLDKDEINNGYITEALKAIIDFAFNSLKLHRIEANIMPRNVRSLKVVKKLGFYEEGLARKYLRINGRWEDHIHMVLLNEDLE